MKTRLRKRSLAAAVTIALSFALTSCGGSTSGVGVTDEPGVAAPDPDGHLRVGYVIPPSPLDPHRVQSDIGAYSYLTPVYDRLTQLKSDGENASLEPMVATEWEFDPDGMSITFTLREDVTFVDGESLDADAVVANFERALGPGSTVSGYLSMVDSVEAVDSQHVRINTNRPAAELPYVLAGAVGSLISPAALDNQDLDVAPVGSGPYIATSVKLGDTITYERRDSYWDKDAQLAKTITIRGMTDDNARLNALRSGQLDMAYIFATGYDQASRLGAGYQMFSYPVTNTYSIYLNTGRTGLDNEKVRQALNFAVDRDGISESLTSGQCIPATQPFGEGQAGHLAEPPIEYSYDPDRARQLLAESGIDDPSFRIVVPNGLALQEGIASAVQAQFREVGIEIEFHQGDSVAAVVDYASGQYDGFIQPRVGQATPTLTLARNYLNPRSFPGTPPTEFIDALESSYDPALSDEERARTVDQATSIATERAFDVFVCAVPGQFAATDKVIGLDKMGISHFQSIFDVRYLGIAK